MLSTAKAQDTVYMRVPITDFAANIFSPQLKAFDNQAVQVFDLEWSFTMWLFIIIYVCENVSSNMYFASFPNTQMFADARCHSEIFTSNSDWAN